MAPLAAAWRDVVAPLAPEGNVDYFLAVLEDVGFVMASCVSMWDTYADFEA